jgi:hypothetical protein
MRKINFSKDVLPHAIAIGVFLIVTIFFFNPVFFDNKVLNQSDITMWEGSSKSMRDYREKTGDEPLWTPSMFSGMPGYLVNVEWGNKVVGHLKGILSFKLPHPICNIYLAFFSYYILLLAFGVRSYLAIAGALAFGLSSYLIIGLSVGHSGRIGAIAFMPLVMAGIHLAFTDKKILGFGVTTAGLALHFRENHLQMTYYLLLIVLAYGIVQLIIYFKERKAVEFFKAVGILLPAVMIAVGTFVGPMWAVTEYTKYSREGSELSSTSNTAELKGVGKSYAFAYNYAIDEPMTLLVPNYYGGSGSNYLVQDRESNVYKALAQSGDERLANELAVETGAYWGPSTQAPYYAGAIIVFLFVAGIFLVEKKYVWWVVPIVVFGIMLSWGSNFASFNYLMFDYLPGYNKFRSVTFAVTMIMFCLPLLAMLAVEKVVNEGVTAAVKRKLLTAFGIVGGICLLLLLFAGALSFIGEGEEQMPPWFLNALADDRKSLLRSDAFRSIIFITLAFASIYFETWKKISAIAFSVFFIALILFDIAIVDARYLTKDNYKRKRENSYLTATEADQEILKDKSYYRVYNIQGAFVEARTSYFHNSIGGYHGVKLRRYQDLYDSCLFRETNELIQDASTGKIDFDKYGIINMLNAKYLVYDPARDNVIPNQGALGNAWFVSDVVTVNSPSEELKTVCEIDTRKTAVVDGSKFKIGSFKFDSAATIRIVEHNPNYLKYESETRENGLAVFSEIYYPKGWVATIDGKEAPISRVNFVLRALEIPAGKHTVEFKFSPPAYATGNTVTKISSWVMLLVLLGSIGWTLKAPKAD